MPKILLLLLALATVALASCVVTWAVFSAIGMFFYSYATAPLALGLSIMLLVLGTGALPVARAITANAAISVIVAMTGTSAAIGVVALAGTLTVACWSRGEWLAGIAAMAILIVYLGLAIGCLVITFNKIFSGIN